MAAWLGVVIGHIGFDLVSGSDIRTFAPLWNHRIGWHLLAMGDVSAFAILVIATSLTFWKRRAAAIGTLVALAVLLGAKAVSFIVSSELYRESTIVQAEPPTKRREPESVSGSISTWRFLDQHEDQMRAWHVDAWNRVARFDFVRRWPEPSQMVRRSRGVPVVRNILALAALPFPQLESENSAPCAYWSDLQFCDRTGCAVRFGVEFGPDLLPRLQVIEILGYRQARRIAE